MSIYSFPGGIDLHVHFREPGFTQKESIHSGLNAATNSGIFSVFDMPNTLPVTDTITNYEDKVGLSQYPNYHVIGGFTNNNVENDTLLELALQARILKVFLANSTGNLGISTENLEKGLKSLENQRVIIMVHAEEESMLDNTKRLQDENLARPPEAEFTAIERVLELSKQFPTIKFHITHVTTDIGAKMLSKQNKVSWDVLPKHLVFNNKKVDEMGNLARMNPPLRSPDIQEELLEMFYRGKIPMLTSDHAPHTLKEKESIIAGAPGVQELYLFAIDQFLRDNLSKELVEKMLYFNPTELLSYVDIIPKREEFSVDSNKNFTLSRDKILSKCKWSLWEDYTFKGAIID